jgi:predicted Zn-dependent peptidase
MVNFERFELGNGLQVFVVEDPSHPMAVFNLLYDVGSRDEAPDKTGFAHLFEHLMFGGSKHIPVYDEPLQAAGGENNAFTNTDITNYYITLPANNLETAFWLESDRMLSLSFDPKVLEVQKKVVIEEFKQRYLNQPYGDAMLKLRPLAYTKHPYMWPTIGKEIAHIENATMDDVRQFFYTHYRPEHATLVVGGNVKASVVYNLAEKWFGEIPKGDGRKRQLPQEPLQTEARQLNINGAVPLKAIYKAYHVPGRNHVHYHAVDLISDLLGRGKSSKLHHQLIKEQRLFNSINAYVTATEDPGLLIIEGKLNEGVSFEKADTAVEQIVANLRETKVAERELDKVMNQAESTFVFSGVEMLNTAMNLAYFHLLGDANRINTEMDTLRLTTTDSILQAAQQYLREDNCSTLYYDKNNT